MKKRPIYILGNPLVVSDRRALVLLPSLRRRFPRYSFIHFDPTEEIEQENDEIVLIDTVVGIQKVTVFNTLNYFSLSPRFSVHDFDGFLSLSLLQKLKKIKTVCIIGVPVSGDQRRVIKDVANVLFSLSSKRLLENERRNSCTDHRRG